MTEKRFIVFKSKLTGLFVVNDNIHEFQFEGVENASTIMKLVGLLNNYIEENEQLKQQLEDLEFKLRTIEAYDRTVKEEHSDTVYDFKKKLEKW